MHAALFAHLCTFLFVLGAFAAKPLKREVCTASCYYSLLKIKYASNNATEQTLCTHPLKVTSTYYCMRIHCEEDDVQPGINWWAATCKKSKKLVNTEAYRAAISNITSEELASLPTVDLNDKEVHKGTAVPSDSNWLVVHRSVSIYNSNRTFNNRIRWIPYGFWALVLLTGICNNVFSFLLRRRSHHKRDNEGGIFRHRTLRQNGLRQWIKANVVMAPTFSHHHHQPWGWFTIPLRLQSMVILSYIIIHVVLIAVHYRIFDENYYYDSRRTQVLRYFGDRLGALLSSSIPLLFLFGGRGNIFICLTGWSYRTFNIFHRWVARILLVEAVVHGVVFSAFDVNDKSWEGYRDKLSSDEIYLYGIMMGVAVGISAGIAHSQVRRRIYEFFKVAHVVLAAIFLAAFYEHVKTQFAGSYNVWAWLCVGIWCGDRVSRVLRLVFINYKSFVGNDMFATAKYSDETGMIRLQVPVSPTTLRHTPGTYYQLSFPGWRFWESHPFSLAGWSSGCAGLSIPLGDEKTGASSPHVVDLYTGTKTPNLTFMIRPKNGMTRRLRDKLLSKNSTGQHRFRVLLEGPYGSPAQLDKFDDILFIVGGSGITAVLPYVRSLLEGKDYASRVPNVRLVWAVRNEGFVRDVLANDLRLVRNSAFAATKLREEFYITSELGSASSSTEAANEGNQVGDVCLKNARPDVDSQVSSFLQEAEGRPAVFVCGPAKMADKARAAVVKQVKNGVADVEFFEELYGW